MNQQILIPLNGSESVEELIPYLEDLSRPTTKIVFFVPCHFMGFKLLIDQLLPVYAGIRYDLLPDKASEQELLQEQSEIAKQRIMPACEKLRKRGVEIEISIYFGPLRRVMRQYIQKQDVQLIMIPQRSNRFLYRLARKLYSIGLLINAPARPPVLLIQPTHAIQRYR